MERELQTFYRMLEDVGKETFMELTCHTMGIPSSTAFHTLVCVYPVIMVGKRKIALYEQLK